MTKLSRSENRSKWLSIVSDYEQCDVNKEQFCKEQQIKKATLDYWIRKSRYQQEASALKSSGFANLLPKVHLADEIRLHFNGVDIYLPISMAPDQLRSLIQNLGR